MAGYENMARFRTGPGPDMISGATVLKLYLSAARDRSVAVPDLQTVLLPKLLCCLPILLVKELLPLTTAKDLQRKSSTT